MSYRIPLILFLALSAHITRAQCNAREYTRIFSEATALQEKGAFIEAKNRYEAAKIYACNQQEKDAADAKIDALFEQIERLRYRADSSAEATRVALIEQQKALAEIVRSKIREAQNQIYHLDYEGAFTTLKSAIALHAAQKEVSDALLEIVFFYAETGQLDLAKAALEEAAKLVGRDLSFSQASGAINTSSPTPTDFRQAIRDLHVAVDSFLYTRYFPTMLEIPGGKDTLENLIARNNAQNLVAISTFRMAKSEITWWQYNLFCEAVHKPKPTKPVGWGGEGDNPVNNVSWYDAVEYTQWLNNRENKAAAITASDKEFSLNLGNDGYRLPTESEWVHAARAGSAVALTKYAGGNNIVDLAWYADNSGNRTHPVMQKKANAYGLYDMSGNVWEWCWDWYDEKMQAILAINPIGPSAGDRRVLLGGSYFAREENCRVAFRNGNHPDFPYPHFGFRVAASINTTNPSVQGKTKGVAMETRKTQEPSGSDLTTANDAARQPNLYLVSIGTQTGMRYSEKDARDFVQIFNNQAASNPLFNTITVDSLYGEKVLTSSVRHTIAKITTKIDIGNIHENDVIMIFIAAAGFIRDGELRLFTDGYNNTLGNSNTLSFKDDILAPFSKMDVKKIIFIDVYFSGGAPNHENPDPSALNSLVDEMNSAPNGLALLVSHGESEMSYEDPVWKNGAFTEAIIKGLTGGASDANNNNVITLRELSEYISTTVPYMVAQIKNGKTQHPRMIRNELGDGFPIFLLKQ